MLEKLKRLNVLMLLATVALVTVGTLTIYSAGNARAEQVFHGLWLNNLATAAVGFALYFVLAFVDYRKLLVYASLPAYVSALVLLVAVLIVGTDRFGGRRWLFFFQPSEISKLCVILFLAALAPKLSGFRGFCIAASVIGFPVLLILLEPDLGTALTLVPACALMLFVARVWRRGLVAMICVGLAAATVILGAVGVAERPGVSPERRERIMRCVPLKSHQVKRVKTFLYPDEDRTGAGYTLRQAKIAIGSGGFSGKGFGKGEANHLRYLPPAISINDFIFCVYAEETGFVGSVVLLSLFALLLVPSGWIAFRCVDAGGRLLALGIPTLIFAHVFVNIGMSVGLVPITGVPLPFISSGRTFLVTVMAGLGLIQSVSVYGKESQTWES